jgi:hypothetical protein
MVLEEDFAVRSFRWVLPTNSPKKGKRMCFYFLFSDFFALLILPRFHKQNATMAWDDSDAEDDWGKFLMVSLMASVLFVMDSVSIMRKKLAKM